VARDPTAATPKTTDPASPGPKHRRTAGLRSRSWATATIAILLLASTLTVGVSVSAPEPAHADPNADEPANGKVAFEISWGFPAQYLYTLDPDGWVMGTTYWEHALSSSPTWSPDGRKLAYTFFSPWPEPEPVSGGIGVVNADNTGATEILKWGSPISRPTWSPDGGWLAFTTPDGTNVGLYKIRIDGTAFTQVLPFNVLDPAWSPDGTTIAVSRRLPPHNSWQIALIDPNGANQRTLTAPNDQFVEAREPAWSPDGTTIAFTGTTPWGQEGIWIMNADGSGATQLTDYGNRPEWSPNSALILYDTSWGPNVVPSSGGPSMQLPNWEWQHYPTNVGGYDWQPVLRAPTAQHTTGLVDPETGKWHLYDVAGTLDTSFYYGNPGDYPFLGDWDCNGSETPGLYRQSDGYVYLRNSNRQGIADIKFYFGNPGDVPIAGDFNGDSCDTVSIYRPSNQRFYIINALGANNGGLGAADMDYVFGDPGDKPFVGDFDGDGIETVGLHRESTGLVYFRNSQSQGNADNQFYFGDPGDRLIAGDWTDDGMFTPGLFRPWNRTMYFRFSNTQGAAEKSHIPLTNLSDWLPVSGRMR